MPRPDNTELIIWMLVGGLAFVAITTSELIKDFKIFSKISNLNKPYNDLFYKLTFISIMMGPITYFILKGLYYYMSTKTGKECISMGFLFPTKKFKEQRLLKVLSE